MPDILCRVRLRRTSLYATATRVRERGAEGGIHQQAASPSVLRNKREPAIRTLFVLLLSLTASPPILGLGFQLTMSPSSCGRRKHHMRRRTSTWNVVMDEVPGMSQILAHTLTRRCRQSLERESKRQQLMHGSIHYDLRDERQRSPPGVIGPREG